MSGSTGGGGMPRRRFLRRAGAAILGVAFSGRVRRAAAQTPKYGSRVVWLHDAKATSWSGTGYYGSSADQLRVNAMLDRGIRELTGEATASAAWQRVIPNYSAGKKVAIKVNLNNSDGNTGSKIDAAAAPVAAVIAGLKTMAVAESDIWVIEPSREFASRMVSPIQALYPGVAFWDSAGTFGHQVTYNQTPSASTTIQHSDPGLTGDDHYSYLPVQMEQVSYFISMPIMKGHSVADISLTFKNNFGMIRKWSVSKLHDYALPGRSKYTYSQNPLHDIYQNSHIGGKMALIVGDGLFCAKSDTEGTPERWSTFGNQFPNSIYLSTDPVAIDSVMYDFLNAEVARRDQSQQYLHRAAELGLGTHEHWNSVAAKQYAQIDFRKIEMGQTSRSDVEKKIKDHKDGKANVDDVKATIGQYMSGS